MDDSTISEHGVTESSNAPHIPRENYKVEIRYYGCHISAEEVQEHINILREQKDVLHNGQPLMRKLIGNYCELSALPNCSHWEAMLPDRLISTPSSAVTSIHQHGNPFNIPSGTLFFGRHDLALSVMHCMYYGGVHHHHDEVYSLLITMHNSGKETPDGSIDYDFSGGRTNEEHEQDLTSAANRALLAAVEKRSHVRLVRQILPADSETPKSFGAAIFRYEGMYQISKRVEYAGNVRQYIRLIPLEKSVSPEHLLAWRYVPPVYSWHGSVCRQCSNALDHLGKHLSASGCTPPSGFVDKLSFTLCGSDQSLSKKTIRLVSRLTQGGSLLFHEQFLSPTLADRYDTHLYQLWLIN